MRKQLKKIFKHIKKHVLPTSLTIIMAFITITTIAPHAAAATSGNYEFNVENNQATITKYTGPGGNVEIPNTLEGYPVVKISCGTAFLGSEIHPAGAFESARDTLTGVTIPNTVTAIDGYAFSGCTKLKVVEFPDSITEIGSNAFENCTGLTDLTIPGNISEIGESAFRGCSGIQSLNIQNGVSKIDNAAFSGCSALTSVNIPDSVKNIDSDSGLVYGPFSECSNLSTVIIGKGVSTLSGNIFTDDTKLTGIIIPKTVTFIDEDEFQDCKNLTIYGGDGSYAKEYAVNHNISFKIQDYQFTTDSGKITITGYSGSDEQLNIPATLYGQPVIAIGTSAFSSNQTLSSVTIPNGVTSIGDNAFNSCPKLASVTLPDSITSIGSSAFGNCPLLSGVIVPKSAKVAANAFNGTKMESKSSQSTADSTPSSHDSSASTKQQNFLPLILLLAVLAIIAIAAATTVLLKRKIRQFKTVASQKITTQIVNRSLHCAKCGAQNGTDALFCGQCGAPLDQSALRTKDKG